MSKDPSRHLHKLMKVADEPGGLASMTEEELIRWIDRCRAGLARVENDKTGRSHKARRGWRELVDAAEAELARRRSVGD